MSLIDIVNYITFIAQIHGVNPELALAVASVESKMNPTVVGSAGEIGLFQLKPSSVGLTKKQLFDPKTNIEAGIKYLKYTKKACHTKKEFTYLVCYNAGVTGARNIKNPKEFVYYKKVMNVRDSLVVNYEVR